MSAQAFTADTLDLAPKTIGVYAIRNTTNGKVYIGSVARRGGFKVRWYEHRLDLEFGENGSLLLQRAWAKYGRRAFVFEVVEVLERCGTDAETRTAVLAAEQRHLDANAAATDGYNILPTAGSRFGKKMTDEQREALRRRVASDPAWLARMSEIAPRGPMPEAQKQKMSAAAVKRWQDPEKAANMLEAMRRAIAAEGGYSAERRAAIGAGNKGKNPSAAVRLRMSESQKARYTDEVRAELSLRMKAKWADPAVRERQAAAQKGRKHSPETLAKMRAAQRLRYSDPAEASRMREVQQRGAKAALERQKNGAPTPDPD